MTASNFTDELCKVCDGKIECAPTAILLIFLVHTLYGYINPEPDYFQGSREQLASQIGRTPPRLEDDSGFIEASFQPMSSELKFVEKVPYGKKKRNQFDFIIVGGGTAGCVLASRLSENRKWRVLVLEAGGEEPKMALIPGLTSEFKGSSIDWQFTMRPKAGFCQNRGKLGCEIVQGRVLGGTSAINDMAYMRGSPADYDEWAARGNDGWNYASILPYFKYSEGNYDKDVSKNLVFHSSLGPLDVGRYPYVDMNVDVLLSAFNELGFNYTDVNGKNQIGFMRIQTMSYFGERVSTYTAFIEPIRKTRNNIVIVTEALVVKILIEEFNTETRAVGVEYIKNGTIYRAYATKEVILSAGAINTPKLLMQSGVGPKDYLEYLGMKVHYDLPVGRNFHDHVSVCLPIMKLSKTATTTDFTDKLKDITTYYSKGIGPLSANFQVVAFMETSMTEIIGTPDIEVRFKGHDSNMYYDKLEICVSLLTPKSRGYLLVNSTDPFLGNPLIYPNFLKDETDIKKIVEGIRQIVRLFDTEIFKTAKVEFDPRPILYNECNDHSSETDLFWACIVRLFSAPLHNYVGTAKMGPTSDSEAVVDNNLRVYGVTNLRVVDASIIPKVPRGSIAAVVVMIAEKASDMIKTFWY